MVILVEKQLRLLKAYYNKVGHRGAFITGKLLLQCFLWPELEEDTV